VVVNMGLYNTIIIPCPRCGNDIECQTKSGACILETYQLQDAPDADIFDINRHAPFECPECGQQGIEVEFGIASRQRTENRRVISN